MSTEFLLKINELIEIFDRNIDYESFNILNWLNGLFSSDNKLECIKSIRSYTSSPELVQKLIDTDNSFIPKILEFLTKNNNAFDLLYSGYYRELKMKSIISIDILNIINSYCIIEYITNLQDEGAWVLINVSGGTSQQTKCVINYGGIPVLIETFKKSSSLQIKSSTIWALGNIAGDCTEFRDLVLNYNILDHILKCIQNIDIPYNLNEYNLELCQNIAWSLSNYCRGKPSPSHKFVQIALKICSIMIKANNDDILHDVAWTLNYLSKIHDDDDDDDDEWLGIERMQLIIDNGFLPYLSDMLQHKVSRIANAALRVIGNIMITGTCKQQKCLFNSGIFKSFNDLITGDIAIIKQIICWIVTNIPSDIIIAYDLVVPLIGCLRIKSIQYSKPAMCTVLNIIRNASNQQISYFVNNQVISAIFVFIENIHQNFDQQLEKCLIWSLEAIQLILMNGKSTFLGRNLYIQYVLDCGGLGTFQSIQTNDIIPVGIYNKIEEIVNAFFDNAIH